MILVVKFMACVFAFSSSDGPENPQTDMAQAVSAKWTVPRTARKDIWPTAICSVLMMSSSIVHTLSELCNQYSNTQTCTSYKYLYKYIFGGSWCHQSYYIITSFCIKSTFIHLRTSNYICVKVHSSTPHVPVTRTTWQKLRLGVFSLLFINTIGAGVW